MFCAKHDAKSKLRNHSIWDFVTFRDSHHRTWPLPRAPSSRAFEKNAMSPKQQMFALLAVGIGLAVTVGMWLLGLLLVGAINLL
jgi:hypothetical protein